MKKLVISLMIVALAVSVQAGTMTVVDELSDLNLTGVVAAINSGSHGPGPDDYPGTDDYSMEHATTVMEGITFDNDMLGEAIWEGHNDDLFLYSNQIANGWDRDGMNMVGPGGSAAPLAWTDTLSRLYNSEIYGGNNPGDTKSESIAIANGTYEVQILVQQRRAYAYSALSQMFTIEGQDSDLYDLVALNTGAGLFEYIEAGKAYLLGGWVYTDTVTVSDGTLDIVVTTAGGNLKYNGIIVTPEPASMVLLGLGGLLLRRRK